MKGSKENPWQVKGVKGVEDPILLFRIIFASSYKPL